MGNDMSNTMRHVELLIIQNSPSENTPGAGKRLVVIQWIKDDKSTGVHLCKLNYWKDEASGEERFKLKGLGLDDLKACNPKWAQIAELMKNPPKVVPAVKTSIPASAKPLDDIEEAPF